MKQTVNFCDFQDAFRAHDRKDQFSYAGKRALFDYLEEYEKDTGEEMELDIVALCCDFAEYSDIEELKKDYPDIEDIDDLRDNTTVIEFDNGFIVQSF